ncbi:MAG: glycosyltransferase family 4 protein, partial [Acidimicrobiales bacterium]|nr:glycosyltransferase family 4 protein [Acidimicrobiales bacterium]
GADPDRVRAVHHGIPTIPSDGPAPADAGPTAAGPTGPDPTDAAGLAPGMGPYVLALGTIEPRKDHPGLVRAFDLLAGAHPELGLVLAGPDGWGTAALEQAVAASGVAHRIVRVGYVSEARRAALLARAAVFAYPSRYEGFGFPPLEAMASGIPVVTTDAGALPEVVGDGALMVPSGDPERLAGALETALYDDCARAELVDKGRRRVACFRWDACAAGLAGLYRDAVAVRG